MEFSHASSATWGGFGTTDGKACAVASRWERVIVPSWLGQTTTMGELIIPTPNPLYGQLNECL